MTDRLREYHISPSAVRELLTGGGEFLPPERLLGDLTEAQALHAPPNSPYSIAGLVAHIHFWQERNIARSRGEARPRPEHLDDTFPSVGVGEWNTLRADFLAGLETCAQVAAEQGEKTSPERDNASLAFDLAECPALHNAYHYGQIAMLRQIQGLWPPVGGDDGW